MKVFLESATITPGEILAGDSVEIRIRLVLGKDFTGEGGRLVFDLPAFLGYSRPSVQHQEDSGYVEIFCSNPDLVYRKRNWDIEIGDFPTRERQSFRGMAQRFFVLDFLGGKAAAGDIVEFAWGYPRSGFGCGVKVTSIVPRVEFTNTIHVRYFADGERALPDFARSFKGYDRPIPDQEIALSYRILPRGPERIRVIRGHHRTQVLLLDRFHNHNPLVDGAAFLDLPQVPPRNADGVYESKDIQLAVRSKGLPLAETPRMEKVFAGMNVYFGDLHTHSSISNDCIEREKQDMDPDDMYRFARCRAGLDFLAITDHHQPWDIERNKIGEGNWETILAAARRHSCDGDFLALPGFEYRGDWKRSRGDTAVVLAEDFAYAEMDDPSLDSICRLWDKFRGRDYLTIPHFHNPGSLPDGEWWQCPYDGVEPVLEIFSCHGSYESPAPLENQPPEGKSRRPDRTASHLLVEKGIRYGLTCNSDGHKGNPGGNSLTAIFAPELTREALFTALRRHHAYGTTNARIRLLFTGNGALMGTALPDTPEKVFHIRLQGEQPFKAVDLLRNGILHARFRPGAPTFTKDLQVADQGPSFWHLRAVQVDNHAAWSSPIWFG